MSVAEQTLPTEQAGRRRCASLLAVATTDELRAAWDALKDKPETKPVRGPETGLVMVRGRIGGGGSPFNLGEATVTRATIALASGTVGHAQALGTDKQKAKLAAIFDALWQEDATRDHVENVLLAPIEHRIATENRAKAEETAATRVDFFTMVRGED
ncbi:MULTISPECIES: phosphonate C-P lyase system protein PhnG [Rhizobiaceae]|jgi:alpha-D-ribose 1-methylphosphonate 5-triphosphate synthase subunit PhnG|uniref:Alpha-D-ribose 1-methylphosphonate 5-triphosphate synthase subunit PhnG n=1 Tax=Aliirhizobium cellulosilyticum TaxID=393664 RepID=A0A7W6S8F0_9HYPH|nr:phosphonate C-P lyase system protein PhnG [Rhizobium cellulosilyticum]MBB4349075.1 alpha-D-ribose 1-methylphosphonate 5-triphosphate synthase subunit PhnG [Rhizobium cellulosilyticum]MBB4412704.1 alpha-D-ribose 1-methylphosphonate 5-triphosphate synthase subunit PhnG [Rhizobium cellulosilyticum]MBB4447336.1 alpha-D-ribose 1-methylphosphonate 5-triphosphate synthase subunit PhnG [Rhizobium cellulosilyticum]